MVLDYHNNYYIHVQIFQDQSMEQHDVVLYMYHKKHDHMLNKCSDIVFNLYDTNLDNDVWNNPNQIANHMRNIS